MSIRSKAIKLAYERPELRSKLLPLIKAAKDKATTPEGAKKLHKQYMEKHPDSKKKPQDFYEKSDEKGGEMPKSLKDSALPQSIKDGAKPASEKEAKEWQAEKKADLKTPEGQKALGEAEAALNDGELDDRGLFAGLGGVVGMGAGTVTMVAAGATGIGFIALPILGGAVAIGATIGAIAGAVSNRRKKNEDEGTKKAAADSRKELERLFTAPTMKDVEAAAPFLDDKGHLDEDKVLKALKGARAKESSKTAGNGHEVLWWLLDQRDFFKMYRTVEKQDKQSAQLLQDITDKLSDSLKIKDNEYNAISRLTQLIKGGQNWDISLQRNNIFKVADLMGIKLPSGMFASQKTAGVLKTAKEHATEEALKKYLKEHPGADPKAHSVGDTEKAKPSGEAKGEAAGAVFEAMPVRDQLKWGVKSEDIKKLISSGKTVEEHLAGLLEKELKNNPDDAPAVKKQFVQFRKDLGLVGDPEKEKEGEKAEKLEQTRKEMSGALQDAGTPKALDALKDITDPSVGGKLDPEDTWKEVVQYSKVIMGQGIDDMISSASTPKEVGETFRKKVTAPKSDWSSWLDMMSKGDKEKWLDAMESSLVTALSGGSKPEKKEKGKKASDRKALIRLAAGLNDLPKVFADMSAMTEGDYEIAMKHRQLKWRSNQWTDVSTWQKAAKAAMPFGYGDFNADKVGRWLKKYEKMGNLEIQAAREYSVALYIRSDNPDLLLQIEKAGRGSSAKVDESDIRKDGTLRLWWD